MIYNFINTLLERTDPHMIRNQNLEEASGYASVIMDRVKDFISDTSKTKDPVVFDYNDSNTEITVACIDEKAFKELTECIIKGIAIPVSYIWYLLDIRYSPKSSKGYIRLKRK